MVYHYALRFGHTSRETVDLLLDLSTVWTSFYRRSAVFHTKDLSFSGHRCCPSEEDLIINLGITLVQELSEQRWTLSRTTSGTPDQCFPASPRHFGLKWYRKYWNNVNIEAFPLEVALSTLILCSYLLTMKYLNYFLDSHIVFQTCWKSYT